MKKTYRKYTWIGNQVTKEDMTRLYQIKEKTGKPITQQVAEAVSEYVAARQEGEKSPSMEA